MEDAGSTRAPGDRLGRRGEGGLGKLIGELAGTPAVTAALGRALDARELAAQAQEAAMGALNIPSAADIERLTRRLRSVAQRLEGIEDALDRLETRLDGAGARPDAADGRLAALETRLDEIVRDLAVLRDAMAPGEDPPPRAQERLGVSPSGADRGRPRSGRARAGS